MGIIGFIGYFAINKAITKKAILLQSDVKISESVAASIKLPEGSIKTTPAHRNYLLDADYLDEEVLKNEKSLQWNDIFDEEQMKKPLKLQYRNIASR
jgi:hypothetical protein